MQMQSLSQTYNVCLSSAHGIAWQKNQSAGSLISHVRTAVQFEINTISVQVTGKFSALSNIFQYPREFQCSTSFILYSPRYNGGQSSFLLIHEHGWKVSSKLEKERICFRWSENYCIGVDCFRAGLPDNSLIHDSCWGLYGQKILVWYGQPSWPQKHFCLWWPNGQKFMAYSYLMLWPKGNIFCLILLPMGNMICIASEAAHKGRKISSSEQWLEWFI